MASGITTILVPVGVEGDPDDFPGAKLTGAGLAGGRDVCASPGPGGGKSDVTSYMFASCGLVEHPHLGAKK